MYRGEVWRVNFAPGIGDEIQKIRPAVIINDPKVGRLALRIVVPITDWKSIYGTFIWFVRLSPSVSNGLTKESGADAFQVKSISEQRLMEKIGELTTLELHQVVAAVGLSIGYKR